MASVVLCVLVLCIFGIAAWAGTNRVESSANPSLQVMVWRNSRVYQLLDAVPLANGDELNISGEVPKGTTGTLYWFDTEAILHIYPLVLTDIQTPGLARFDWPAKDKYQPLGGPVGTEVVLVCASRGQAPAEQDVKQLISGDSPWPSLANDQVISVAQDGVKLNGSQGPEGSAQAHTTNEALSRANRARAELMTRFKWVSGFAFPHHQLLP